MAQIKERKEIENKFKWRLEDIFETDEKWEEAFLKVKILAEKFSLYRGKVSDSAEILAAALSSLNEISDLLLSVYVYAAMRRDEDNENSKYRAMADRAEELQSEVLSCVSFFEPEIVAMGREKVENFIETVGIGVYHHFFDNLFREAEHVLSESEEKLLALSLGMSESAHNIFLALNNADIKFGEIADGEGKLHELTHGRYGTFLESDDRTLRRSAYEAMYKQYKTYKNTFAAAYAGSVKSDLFFAKARKYDSTLSMRLSDSFVPERVYDALISEVETGLPVLSEYLSYRKKKLALPELCMYDLYTPLVSEDDGEIPFEEAIELVLSAVAPLGEQYTRDLRRAFSEGWIDVYENRGKTPGAYSWGDNIHHPFVLLNYQGKLEDVFTLAHEMGHAMHSYYTNKTQNSVYRDYKIFVAEVASTVNENLLLEYLLKDATGVRRDYLLGRRLEAIRTTFYRQTMFAAFEKKAHEAYSNGEALTAERLCEIYGAINKKYYGENCVCDENISYEWARIPHFYSSFYVYQYATGFAAATRIKELVLSSPAAAEKYMEFLRSGNSDYPLALLRATGVDLERPDAARSVIRDMKEALSILLDK